MGRQSIPSRALLDPPDSVGWVNVTGPESSVKAIRGAESRGAGLASVDLLDMASPSAVTKSHNVAWQSGILKHSTHLLSEHCLQIKISYSKYKNAPIVSKSKL